MQPNLHHTTLGLHSHARTFIGYRLDSTYMFIHTITVVYMYKLNGSGRHTAAHSGCVRGHFTLSRCHCINVLGMFFEVLLSASRLVILITASALPHTKQTVAVLLHSFHGSCFSIDVHCCTYIYIYICMYTSLQSVTVCRLLSLSLCLLPHFYVFCFPRGLLW